LRRQLGLDQLESNAQMEAAMIKAIGLAGVTLLVVAQVGVTISARAEVVKLQAELKGS